MSKDDFKECFTAAVFAVSLLVLLLTIGGCTKKVYVPVETHSTQYIETERVVTRIDTVEVEVALPPVYLTTVTPDTTSYLCTDFAESWATWSGGMLHHTLSHKDTPAKANVLVASTEAERVTMRIDTIYKPVEVQVSVEVEKRLTRWQQCKQDWFTLVALVALALAAWTFRRPLLSFIQYMCKK